MNINFTISLLFTLNDLKNLFFKQIQLLVIIYNNNIYYNVNTFYNLITGIVWIMYGDHSNYFFYSTEREY